MPRAKSPCFDQTREQIEAYYRTAPEGAPAAIRHTQGGWVRYTIAEIEGRNPRAGRVYIRGHGAFYMRTGKCCFAPTGQSTLVEPTEAVIAWANAGPHGAPWGIGHYEVDYRSPQYE